MCCGRSSSRVRDIRSIQYVRDLPCDNALGLLVVTAKITAMNSSLLNADHVMSILINVRSCSSAAHIDGGKLAKESAQGHRAA